MKVLHIIASCDSSGGGPIEGVLRQAEKRFGDYTDIVTLDPPDAIFLPTGNVRILPLGIPTERWRWARKMIPWRRFSYSPYIVPWLRQHAADYDLVIVNGLWNYCTMAARFALVGSRSPYVVFTHGMLDPWFRRTYPLKNIAKQIFWLISEGPLLAGARFVLFTTEEEEKLAHNAFWPYCVRARVINYGTADIPGDLDAQVTAFTAAIPELACRRYFLFLGRIHPKKGCDLLIEAFAELATLNPDIDLVIAGPDQVNWISVLKRRACQLGIADRIHWPGMLRGDVKWGAYRACEAFVLFSHQENFGIVVAEALAAGKPVLLSDKVNIWREIIADGAGLVGADDKSGARQVLQNFLTMSPDKRQAMGDKARACFLARFEIKRATASIFAAYEEAARKCPS